MAIQLRGGTAAEATAANVVLAVRQLGVETDTGRVKVGNGVTAWNALPYSAPTAHAASHAPAGTDDLTTALSATAAPLALVATADAGTGVGFSRQGHLHPTTGLVRDTGIQNIGGAKNFTASPTVPTPLTETQVAPKGYIDGLLANLDAEPIYIPSKILDATAGTWTFPTLGTNGTIGRGLADTIVGRISTVLRLPTSWTSAEFAVYWTVPTAVAGNVHMQAVTNQYPTSGGILSAGAAATNIGPFAVPGVIGQIVRTSLGNIGLNTNPIKQFVLLSSRSDASDTYPGELQVVAFEIVRVA